MKEFLVLNGYPTNLNKNKLEKNFGFIILVIIIALTFYFIFNVATIAAGSNILRGILFLTISSIGLWKINQPATEIPLEIDEDTIKIGSTKFNYSEIYGFDIVDLNDYLEILIVTTRLTSQFEYIYIPSHSPDAAVITKLLLENIEYVEELNDKDFTHKMLRKIYIK